MLTESPNHRTHHPNIIKENHRTILDPFSTHVLKESNMGCKLASLLLVSLMVATVSAQNVTLQINFSLENKKANIVVDLDSTVSSLKQKVHDEFNVPLETIWLLNENHILEDNLLLASYNLKDRTEILMLVLGDGARHIPHFNPSKVDPRPAKILISQSNNTKVAIDVDLTETVLSLKERIYQKMGIPVASQTLLHGNDILQDIVTLEGCQITNNDDIFLLIVQNH